ncbi:hypothetical protein RI129_011954 [Pyrocoelia pectoralis]|uniref:Uncharacterized protein n=1 Tax=Pyrocoelia pectoralis TaxID=417401 RepID=A0AAN7V1B5_9COLE
MLVPRFLVGLMPGHQKNPINQKQSSTYVFFELTLELLKIASCTDFNGKVRNNATAFLHTFVSFETVVTAMIFLQIFKITTPLSDYLQTRNLDYAQAWRLVE